MAFPACINELDERRAKLRRSTGTAINSSSAGRSSKSKPSSGACVKASPTGLGLASSYPQPRHAAMPSPSNPHPRTEHQIWCSKQLREQVAQGAVLHNCMQTDRTRSAGPKAGPKRRTAQAGGPALPAPLHSLKRQGTRQRIYSVQTNRFRDQNRKR
jgi:hypothetical protein